MSAFLEAIAEHLELSGLAGGSTGWAIHLLGSQSTPDNTVTIYETAGPEPEEASDRSYFHPSFQIVVRAGQNDSKTANDKANAILRGLNRAPIDGFAFFRATQSTPFTLGPDQNARHRFSVNFRAGES